MTNAQNSGAVELLPCPFCGKSDNVACASTFVECANCGGLGPDGPDPNDAIAAWNRRATPARSNQVDWWLYQRATGEYYLCREQTEVEDHWTETPLYASPAPSDQAEWPGEPFGYFVEHTLAESAFLRPPAYIPHGEGNYRVTPLYTCPEPYDQEKLADMLTKAVGDISTALTIAGKQGKIAAWTKLYVDALNEHDARARQTTAPTLTAGEGGG
jgi:Lar family restriction alleviation protein